MDLLPDLVAGRFLVTKRYRNRPKTFTVLVCVKRSPTQYVLEEIHQASTVNISLNVLKT